MTPIKQQVLGIGELLHVGTGFGGHGAEPPTPQEVIESLAGRVTLVEQPTPDDPGLRTPQIGALHSLLAQRTLGHGEPSTVVLPTGTGKTDTMIASFCLEPDAATIYERLTEPNQAGKKEPVKRRGNNRRNTA